MAVTEQKRFLIFNNGMIGNTLFNMPAAAWLKQTFPGCFVGMVVDKVGLQLVKHDPNVDVFHTFNKKRDGLGYQFKLIMALRREKYDLSLHLRKGVRNELIARLAGVKRRAGYRLKGSPQHLHIRLDENKKVHRLGSRAEFLETVFERKVELERPRLSGFPESRDEFGQLLKEAGTTPGEYFVLHPTGDSQVGIQWTLPHHAEAVEELKSYGHLFVICMPNERPEVEKHIPSGSRVHYYTGSIATTVELIANARVFLGNDSGPAHIACAVDVPRVVLYKAYPENYAQWSPADMTHCKVLFNDDFSGKAIAEAALELLNEIE